MRIELAQLYVNMGRYVDARQQLQSVLAERAPTDRPRWTLKEVPRARQMLESIRDKKLREETTDMRFSVCVMADVDEIGFFSHAEALGYDSVWVTDSQMLFSDCYAVLALAAQQTRRIRLGPGVAICGTRIPPVHVAAMATLNRLAPGRVHLGVGTGNTATRSMGQPPMRIAEYAEHLRVLRGLLRGEAVDYAPRRCSRVRSRC